MTDTAPARWKPERGPIKGKPPERLNDGQVLSDLRESDIGNGLVRADRPVRSITMKRIIVNGGYRVFENLAAQGQQDASIDGLLIEDVKASGLARGFARIQYDSRHGIIRRVEASGVDPAPALPCGIAFNGTAHDFSIEDCVMRDFRMRKAEDQYWNGDGYSSERGNYGLRFLRCSAFDCTDGGFDLKSTGTFLDGCVAGGNKRNYRFWSNIEAYVLTSLSPVNRGGTGQAAHVHVVANETQPVIEIAKLVVRSENDAPLISVEGQGATIVIATHDISVPPGTAVFQGKPENRIVWKSEPPRL